MKPRPLQEQHEYDIRINALLDNAHEFTKKIWASMPDGPDKDKMLELINEYETF